MALTRLQWVWLYFLAAYVLPGLPAVVAQAYDFTRSKTTHQAFLASPLSADNTWSRL